MLGARTEHPAPNTSTPWRLPLLQDLTLTIKYLRRSPLFVAVAVTTLGLGIGLTSTMLTMLDSIMHPYVPYRDVSRLFSVIMYGDGGSRSVTAFEKYQVLMENTNSFEDVAAVAYGFQGLVEAYGNAAQVGVNRVTGNYFPLLGMEPETGRFFHDGPSAPDEDKAVVSYGIWQQVLASRPLERGVSLTVDGRAYDVIGVMPPETATWRLGSVVLRVAGLAGVTPQQRRSIYPLVRLKTDVTDSAAYAELGLVATRLKATYGEGRQMFQLRLQPWDLPPDQLTEFQLAMGGATIAILLIACANLANLMLVRGLNRRPELALRLALGAGRRDLIRQLFTESALVGLLGGAVGTMLAVWGVGLVRHRLPVDGRWIGFMIPHLDWRVYAFAVGTTVAAVLVFGLGPALAASDVSVSEPLKEAGSGISGTRRRRYSVLVISEVAICLVLLMAAGLLIRTLDLYVSYLPDYESKGLLQGNINLSRLQVPDSLVDRQFVQLRDRLRQVPGVTDVATMGSGKTPGSALTSDLEGPEPRFIISGGYMTVSPEYVGVMGYRLIAGRDLAPGDGRGSPVAIVDEAFGERLWPGLSPLNRMIKLGGPSTNAPWARVVGVLRSPRDPRNAGRPASGQMFVMVDDDRTRFRSLAVRVTGKTPVVAVGLRRKIGETFPAGTWGGGYFFDSDETARQSLQAFSFVTRLFTSLGGLGLVLASVGMYGVLAYSVGQRMREFGIRIALGAETRSLFRLVLHDAAVMILAGTAIGAWFAMWAGTMMITEDTSPIPPTDWIALVSAEVVLLLVCFGACLTPAIRASRANPLDIIRAI